MTTTRRYPKAPITEAIIDIRVRLPEEVRLLDLESLHDEIREGYPDKLERKLARGLVEVGTQVSASASQKQIGFVFKSANEKQIVQFRLDGFTMSRLAPYESWELFRDEAKRLWELYRPAANPKEVTRLAIRYVNRIDIPLPIGALDDYFRTYPELSSDLSQTIEGLFMQLAIPQPDIECLTLLNEALTTSSQPNAASIILDIDLIRKSNVPQDDVGIWELLEILRLRKNEVFEACITDKTRELFE